MSRVAGIVLCGGHSRRMGRPKAWLPIGDETFLQRIVRVVGEAVGDVIVVAAEGQDLPLLPPHVRRVDDSWPDCGPMGGFAAGLAAVGPECEAVYLSSCDTPMTDPNLVRNVIERLLASDVDAVVPEWEGPHPLAAAYRPRVRSEVEGRLASGDLRMIDLVASLRCQFLGLRSLDTIAIRNVNTPEEFAALSKP